MDEAVHARAAAHDAIEDITPRALRNAIEYRLENATLTPAVLTRLSAHAAHNTYEPAELDKRTAGVQLIYNGLHLTRFLARTSPWDTTPTNTADIEILAAEVLVARGFSLLANTDAAPVAVTTVQTFGQHETTRVHHPTTDIPDSSLEANIFELAITAGLSATGTDRPSGTTEFATDLARSYNNELPTAPELLSDSAITALKDLIQEQYPSTTTAETVWASTTLTDP